MSKPNVLYVTSRPARHQENALKAAPSDVSVTMHHVSERAKIIDGLKHADFMISERALDIDKEMISAGQRLKLIQRIGRLTYDIDVSEAEKRNIPVCYFPVQRCAKVAEHAMMQILMLQRNFRLLEHVVRSPSGKEPVRCGADAFAYNWGGVQNVDSVLGAVIGIIGFGEIGAELALRLKPFGCKILYNKRSQLPAECESSFGVQYRHLDALLAESDVVVVLLPHSGATVGLVDTSFIRQMKPGAKLVATGASTVLNENDVADAYSDGSIGGVATDGWNFEPIEKGNRLVRLADDPSSNVAFTPHVAAGSGIVDWMERQAEYENVRRVVAGQTLVNRVDFAA